MVEKYSEQPLHYLQGILIKDSPSIQIIGDDIDTFVLRERAFEYNTYSAIFNIPLALIQKLAAFFF